jgi:membrane peptidoglycan carboxypeptidase
MHRNRWRFILPAAALLVGALAAGLALFIGAPVPQRPAGETRAASILITDRTGRTLYEAIDPNGSKQAPVPLAEIPLACRDATIATEDSRFYAHPGVDLLGIARALWQNWRTGEAIAGTSTLTQQLARNLYLPEAERTEHTLRRKLREAWLAWRLERTYSKDELLALYLNTTYYGHFATGIEAAAQAYFGVHARELDLAQCALLAGLPQAPTAYNPIENPEAAQRRQAVVLGLMARHGIITPAQAEEAGGERLAFAATPFPIEAPHFVMWVQSQLETLLGADRVRGGGLRVTTTLDLDWQRQAEAIVARRLAQLRPCAAGFSLAEGCDADADPARRVENAALIALDPHTGAVLALVGSPDYFDSAISGAVNAALAQRQPGSAIKPLTYAAALDPERAREAGEAPLTAATIIPDLRAAFLTAEGEPYVPNNYDRRYHGPVTVRTALANSYNIPAVRTLDAIGVDALIEQAARLGIPWEQEARDWELEAGNLKLEAENWDRQSALSENSSSGVEASAGNSGQHIIPAKASIPENDQKNDRGQQSATSNQLPASRYGLSLTLGGGEVRLLDLTAAYAAFANDGARVEPYAIARVETLEGETIWDQGSGVRDQESEGRSQESASLQLPASSSQLPAVDPRVAYLITDMLSDERARVPAFGQGNMLEIGRPAAAKTGTTTDWRDNWTLGYTPDLTVGVWVGNADNTPMKGVSGISGAGPIWHDFMRTVLRERPPLAFTQPDGLVRVEVCADSGLLPMAAEEQRRKGAGEIAPLLIACPQRRYEWFVAGTEPTEVDRSHVEVVVDARSGRPADASTPPEYVQPQTTWLLPPEYAAWARENDVPQLAQIGATPEDTGTRRRGAHADAPLLARGSVGPEASGQVNSPLLLGSPSPPLSLTSPDPNRVYALDPGLPPSAQQVPLTALPRDELSVGTQGITLLADDVPLAIVAAPDYTAWWPLTAGRHTFRAVATRADGSRVESEPVTVLVK